MGTTYEEGCSEADAAHVAGDEITSSIWGLGRGGNGFDVAGVPGGDGGKVEELERSFSLATEGVMRDVVRVMDMREESWPRVETHNFSDTLWRGRDFDRGRDHCARGWCGGRSHSTKRSNGQRRALKARTRE